ncbi:ABC transporter permease [Thermoflavimicrobium daqui]|uniref:Peptide ABC transporter permease n=1 Tax=Thermoflavimicrobium daqui TaxID=2137476 RepID=A0A364K9R2_9BACL|nr:ABC transporter permease [Thermoflavimicrobium daqui]RAL27018.1 peptide ABC transporter permease [Thermoflavimicrobium daqui]
MLAYTVRRLFMLIPVLVGMSIITFGIVHMIPGDPAQTIAGEKATPQRVEEIRKELGLDEPLYIQYGSYAKGLLQGDLGKSMTTKRPIGEEIGPFLAATAELVFAAMFIAVFFGVNLGILSSWRQNSWFDYSAMMIALIGVSIPVFWLGLMEQWLFAQTLDWLPSNGRLDPRIQMEPITYFYVIDTILYGDTEVLWDAVKHLILPAVALATVPMAIIARITRSSMLEVMRSDYIRTARAKGLSEFWVVYKHTLKNASIPVLTVIGLQLGTLLGGAVLTETIFSWPGVGRYLYTAIGERDYTVVQSGILIVATIFVIINLIVDLIYAWIDPRIQYGKK